MAEGSVYLVSGKEESVEKRRVQIIAQAYYARKEVQDAIYNFCKNRETIPRYLDGFGKRPDILDYPSDILSLVKKGATSFNCSEELWIDPLRINTNMTPEQYNELRLGWDFLIDIDSRYLDYSRIAANLIIKFLEHHGVENIGIKFSGSKGFHILIPWKSFPKTVDGEETKTKFPEWPRAIAQYISENIHEKLVDEISKISDISSSVEIVYLPTKEKAFEKTVANYLCRNCKAKMSSTILAKKVVRCQFCKYDLEKISEEKMYVAESNQDNSRKNPQFFVKKPSTKNLIESVDIVLVAPRHLFRTPYSLHEKTSLVSTVLTKEELKNFEVRMADPLKADIKNYSPDSKADEAKELLIQSLDWAKKKEKTSRKFDGKSIDLKGLKITEDMFPEVIKNILSGIKQDGRKRALSILVAFFSSLDFPKEYIEEKISEWNKKNYMPLKEGYLKSQIDWGLKNKRLPPNYDKPIYRELGLTSASTKLKNPINYTIKKAIDHKKTKNK